MKKYLKINLLIYLTISIFVMPLLVVHATNIGTNITTTGTLSVDGALKFTSGASDKYVLVTDASGNATWTAVSELLAFGDGTTDNLTEGSSRLYYSDTKVDTRINLKKGVAGQLAPLDVNALVPMVNLPAGTANGLATLDGTGKIPSGQIPSFAINDTYVVADITARDALSPTQGDVAIVTDAGSGESRSYIWDGAAWVELLTPLQLYLSKGNNLSDLTNTTTARTNIGLGSGATPTFSGLNLSNGLQFTSVSPLSYAEGLLFYNTNTKSLSYYNDHSGVIVDVGQESLVRVYNQSGSTIGRGKAVYINGASSATPTIGLAQANDEDTAEVVAIAVENIPDNSYGYVSAFGMVENIDTSAFAAGEEIYLSESIAGAMTNIRPTQPNYTVRVGYVVKQGVGDGVIFITSISHPVVGRYATGAIGFGGTDGFLNADENTFLWDNTNKRLGIGDATPQATLTVGNGDLFEVFGDSGNITTSGDLTFSTTGVINTGSGALTLQPAGSSTSSQVQIGAGGGGSTTPDVLVLDIKSNAGDPTGTNGAMYYNSSTNKYRCFENSSWKDCDTTGATTTLQTAYNNGATITTAGSTNIAFTLTSGNLTATGAGAVNLTPTSASSFTSGGALTLTAGATSTWGTSTGNLTISSAGSLAMQGGGASSLSTTSGALTLQPAGSSTTSQVQIGIGGAGSTTPDVLVLDIKSNAGDPTGTNGAMYYNSSTNKYRCYQSGAWGDCGSAALSSLTAATTINTIDNGDNSQSWNWSLTTADNTGIEFGESSASTATGSPSIIGLSTLSSSTATPLYIHNFGDALSMRIDDSSSDTSPFIIDADGNVGIGTDNFDPVNPERLKVEQLDGSTSFNLISARADVNNYVQFNIQNKNAGNNASSDIVATADNGNESVHYVDLGINSSGYTNPAFSIVGANDAYLYAASEDLAIGTANTGKALIFHTGGTTSSDERMRITGSGNVGIATTTPGSELDVKGELRLSGATSGYVGFVPAAVAGSTTYTLPDADGAGGQFLTTNGTGGLSWTSGFADPMTTRGDLIYRDNTNTTVRLPRGTAGQMLKSDGTDIAWATPTKSDVGLGNVTNDAQVKISDYGVKGDILSATGASVYAALALGTNGQVLTADSTQPGGIKWTTPSSGFADPMTTRGDLIYRDNTNTTVRLPRGTAGQMLKSDGTDIAWATPTKSDVGLGNVTNDAQLKVADFTAKGVVLAGTGTGTYTSLTVGTNGQVLTADSTQASGVRWVTPASGFADPMTTRGDIIYRDSTNTTDRLALGTNGQVLHSDGTDLSWYTITKSDVGLGNVTNDAQLKVADFTAKGVVLAGTGTGTYTSLTVGTNGQVLTADSTQASGVRWVTPASGFADPMTTRGDLIYRDNTNTTVRLPRGTAGQMLKSDGTDIAWATPTKSDVGLGNVTNDAQLKVADFTAKGDILSGTGAGTYTSLAVGVNGKVLIADSTQAGGLIWGDKLTDPMTTRGDFIYRNTSNTTARLAVGSNGQVIKSNGTDPAWATLTNTDVGLSNVTNEAQIAKSIGLAKGDIIAFTGSGTPVRLPYTANNGEVLTIDTTQTTGLKYSTVFSNIQNADLINFTELSDTMTVDANTSINLSGRNLTITDSGAGTISFASGNGMTLQSGSGTVSLGTSTGLSATGALTVSSGGANTLTIQPGGAAGLNLGTANANAITIGSTGVTTTTLGTMRAGQNGASGTFVLYSEQGVTDHIVTMQPNASMTGDTTYVWPAAQGGVDTFLRNDGSGNLSWTSSAVVADSLDFTEFADSMSLDATTSIGIGNNNLNITTAGTGVLTLTSGGASTWSTTTGALTVDAGAALNLGTTNASSVSIGKTGSLTTIQGNLGVSNYVDFTPITAPTHTEGRVFFDQDADGLAYYDDTIGIKHVVGQSVMIQVYNSTGGTLNKGQVVYVNGTFSGVPTVTLAQANSENTSRAIGIVVVDISNGTHGHVITNGKLDNINTSLFSVGDPIYLSASVAGGMTSTRPTEPNFAIPLGYVAVSDASTGVIVTQVVSRPWPGSYTVGGVPFANSNGFLTSDVTNLFWDNSTKRLGIGDATPTASLVVGSGDLFQVFGASGNITTAGDVVLSGGGSISTTSGGALTLTGDGASSFSTNSGAITFQAAGSGTTSNIQLGVGGAGSTTPDLLGLDVKSNAGDPTGFNGAMYYNSSASTFRCFEAGVWKDCDTTGAGNTLQTTYNNGATITTAGSTPIAFTLTSGNFNVSGAGSVNMTPTGASSFTSSGALTFTAGAASVWSTTAGSLTINAGTTTPAGLNLGTSSTNAVSIGNSGATFALTSSGGLNVTTGGALTGVASIDTIAMSATAMTFAGAGTISSGSATALALTSGTTGAINIGTDANAKTITIGNSTGATALVLDAGTGGVKIGDSTATPILNHLSATQANLASGNILTLTCGAYGTITVTGAAVGDTVIATPTAVTGGIETVNLIWNAYVSATNTVTIRACNPTAAGINTANTQTWRADVWKH